MSSLPSGILKKRTRRWFRWVPLILFILYSFQARGEEVPPFPVTGSAQGGYWTGSRSLDDREDLKTASLWIKTAPAIGSLAKGHFEGWIINSDLFQGNETMSMLREGYIDLAAGPFDFRIGKQIIVWGRADQVNPTDHLSPRDYTLLFPDENDQRFGSIGLKGSTNIGAYYVQGYWIPFFKPNHLPLPQSSAQLTFREQEPDNAVGQWGVKVESTGRNWDGSISYYDGFDLDPDLSLDSLSVLSIQPPPLNILLSHHRIQTFGIDGAAAVERFGLRGEAAYTLTENSDSSNPFIKSPFLFFVLGGERTFLDYLNINLQFIFREVLDYQDPGGIADPIARSVATEEALFNNQLDRISEGASIRVSNKWFNETLEAELAGIGTWTRHDTLIRPKATYAITDQWKIVVAADIYRGPDDSFFGSLSKNTASYTEISYHF
ncbi:MAG: hypothetical protein HY200_01995 [Nitrospirae bacterium]|nr:hypothetical protein [Nitrospirota bacterium]